MDKQEWESLFELNTELNSPESRAIHEELRKLQELYMKENQRTEPIEAKQHAPYTETAGFREEIQKVSQIERSLQEIREVQEFERQARMEAEQQAEKVMRKQAAENRAWQIAATTIGLLTLAATVLFGVLALLR